MNIAYVVFVLSPGKYYRLRMYQCITTNFYKYLYLYMLNMLVETLL